MISVTLAIALVALFLSVLSFVGFVWLTLKHFDNRPIEKNGIRLSRNSPTGVKALTETGLPSFMLEEEGANEFESEQY